MCFLLHHSITAIAEELKDDEKKIDAIIGSSEFETIDNNNNGSKDQDSVDARAYADVNVSLEEKEAVSHMRTLTLIISDMSKYSILITIAILSTFIVYFIGFILSNTISYYRNNRIIGIMTQSIDNIINCICLILQYKFARNKYKFLCNRCHLKCENRYTNDTNQKLASDANNENELVRLTSGQLGLQSVNNYNVNNNNNNNNNKNNNDRVNDHDAHISQDLETNIAGNININSTSALARQQNAFLVARKTRRTLAA